MNKERYQLIRQVFLEVRDLPTAAQPEFLAHACVNDDELRAAVEQLLADEKRGSRFLSCSALRGYSPVINRSPLPGLPSE